jgi:miniconductance mechanosensitive channel
MEIAQVAQLFEDPTMIRIVGLAGLLGVCAIANWVMHRFVVRGVEKLALRSASKWDDALHEAQVFDRLAPLIPALILGAGIRVLPEVTDTIQTLGSRIAAATVILVAARAVAALLTAANRIYSEVPENRERPIKGYLQVVKIVVAVVATILILATLLDRSPLIFLSGIGAMTAVLLLIFRDTILSLVASVQITGNDMVRVGDWIEMPQLGADGDVIDVALHTVKVQNWDKTITSIPTHRLISDSFKNWRFMSLSGGRRIKRALAIDMTTVRFLDPRETDRLARVSLLADYVEGKRKELAEHNQGRDDEGPDLRRLTNLGTFRAYIERYLRAHPRIHPGMTLIVRQLAPTPTGIPIEIYCFTSTTEWAAYEGIQSDLFDHFLSIAPEFGLRAFQSPSGADVAALSRAEGA